MQRLSPDTQLAAWRVVAFEGQGAYGAVYRAVRIGQEHSGPGALKLSRLSHPSIPRLLDRGVLRPPSGDVPPQKPRPTSSPSKAR